MRFSLALLATAALAGCQATTPIYTPITPVVNPEEVAQAEKPDTFSVRAVPTGGIIMRRVNDPDYEAPKREVDKLRDYVTQLTQQLETLNKQSQSLSGSVQQLQTTDARLVQERSIMLEVLEEKFGEVESRIDRTDGAARTALESQKQQLEQAIAQIRSQGSTLSKVSRNVEEGDAIREQLLAALDTKFAEIDASTSKMLAGLTDIERQQVIEKQIAEAKEQARKAAREERLLEELEFRKKLESLRRSQILSEQKALTEREKALEFQLTKERAILEDKISGAVQKIARIEEEERREKEALEARLKNVVDMKISGTAEQLARLAQETQREKEVLEGRLSALQQDVLSAKDGHQEHGHILLQRIEALESTTSTLKEKVEEVGELGISTKDVERAMGATPVTFESSVQLTETAVQRAEKMDIGADQWIDLQDYHVVVHADNKPLDQLLKDILKQAEPYTGPWDIKWKLKAEHEDILAERFSLDAETEFSRFTSYLSSYMESYRGFGLTFNIFAADRVLVVTDQ